MKAHTAEMSDTFSCTEGPMEATPSQTYDVVIAATSADAELVAFIKGELQEFAGWHFVLVSY